MNSTLAPAAARARRAAVARRLVAGAPEAVAALGWDELDTAPDWLALPEPAFTRLQCRAGALMCARTIRLWIDGARLAAARLQVGDTFLNRLVAEPDATPVPLGTAAPPMERAADIAPALKAAGAAVLLVSLPHGPLREAVGTALAPVAPTMLTADVAQRLLERADAGAAP